MVLTVCIVFQNKFFCKTVLQIESENVFHIYSPPKHKGTDPETHKESLDSQPGTIFYDQKYCSSINIFKNIKTYITVEPIAPTLNLKHIDCRSKIISGSRINI